MLEILVWGLVSLAPAAGPPPWVPPKIPVAEDRFGPWITGAPPAPTGVVPVGLFQQSGETPETGKDAAPTSPEFTVPMGVLPAYYGKPEEPPDSKKEDPPAPLEFTVPAPRPTPVAEEEEIEEEEAAAGVDRWPLMQALQSTWPGMLLDDNRLQLYGWIDASYNFSSAAQNNQPVVWNDRANEFLLQQVWLRFEKTVVTSGTTTPTFGFRVDWLYGTDYRFTLPVGLWNSQLQNADGAQNLYGFDPIAFYVEGYFPTICQGTDVKVGRWFTPFGVESLEAVSTPLMSRSYAFNWCPPFTHFGILGTTTVNPQWTVQYAVVNGNDVSICDDAQEPRFVGTLKYTHPNGRDVVTLGTSLGRGKFNDKYPNPTTTAALANEPAGRNNINVFDMVYSHTFNPRLTYTAEVIYGYQYDVPANVPGGIIKENAVTGTAHWGSIVNYLFCNLTPNLSSVIRLEAFDDFEGQRTGFEGVYWAGTAGVQIKPHNALTIRPEVRYDYNGYSKPFEGKHWLFTAGADVILRW